MWWLIVKYFYQSVTSDMRTNDNIRKIVTGQRGDYTTSGVLVYNYLNEHYKMIAIDLIDLDYLVTDYIDLLIYFTLI